jgi:hypothetical protein
MITNNSLVQIGTICQLADDECLPLPIRGFSTFEVGKIIRVWAIDKVAELKVPDAAPHQDHQLLSFDLATLNARVIKISTSNEQELTIRLLPGQVEHVELQFPSQKNGLVQFVTDTDGVKPTNGDARILFFDVENPTIKRAGH